MLNFGILTSLYFFSLSCVTCWYPGHFESRHFHTSPISRNQNDNQFSNLFYCQHIRVSLKKANSIKSFHTLVPRAAGTFLIQGRYKSFTAKWSSSTGCPLKIIFFWKLVPSNASACESDFVLSSSGK